MSLDFPTKIVYICLTYAVRTLCTAYRVLNMVTKIRLYKERKLSPCWVFFVLLLLFFLPGQNIMLIALFSTTFNMDLSRKLRYHLPQPLKQHVKL